MNIQIFGWKKSADSRKAERFFKERRIRFQWIEMREKGMSRGEMQSVSAAVGGIDRLLDNEGSDKDLLALIRYLTPSAAEDKLLEHPELFKVPIVRNGRKATVGYCPETWKAWIDAER